jgi:hypothetical protein
VKKTEFISDMNMHRNKDRERGTGKFLESENL